MGYSITIRDRVRFAVALVVIQTKPQDLDIETHVLTLRQQFPLHPHATKKPPSMTNNDNLILLNKCHELESQISSLKRKLVVTELELAKKVVEVKAPPAKKKKIIQNTDTNTPTPKNAIAGPSTLPPTSNVTSADGIAAKPSGDITPAKKRKPRAKTAIAVENVETVDRVEKMDMSSIPKGFTHAEAAVMLFGPPGNGQDDDHHILASLLDLPKILNCTADQFEVLTSYSQTIIEACGEYIAEAVVSQRPETQCCDIPPLRLISNISEILCRFLPRLLRNLAKSEENSSQILVSVQENIIGRCIKWLYHLSLWDSKRLSARHHIGAQDVAFGLVQFVQRLIDATSQTITGVTDSPMNSAVAELVAAQGMAEIIHLRQGEHLRVEAEKRELRGIQASREIRKFLCRDPITTDMYRRKQESIASDHAQHYLITLVEHALPHLPLNRTSPRMSSNSGTSQNALVFSIRSMLLKKLLESGIFGEATENRISAVSQRLTELAEKLSLAEDEEQEAIQRVIDNALRITEDV